jgi:hypothetical protein
VKMKRYPAIAALPTFSEALPSPECSVLVVELPDDRIEKSVREIKGGILAVKMSLWNPDGGAYTLKFWIDKKLLKFQPQALLWTYQRKAAQLLDAWNNRELMQDEENLNGPIPGE